MPPTPPPPLVIPAELLSGFTRAMEATQADARAAREAAEETRDITKDAAAQNARALEELRAEFRPILEEWHAFARARRDAAVRADAERLEAVGGLRSVAAGVLGSATVRSLLIAAASTILGALAARYGLEPPLAPQDVAPHSQEATP